MSDRKEKLLKKHLSGWELFPLASQEDAEIMMDSIKSAMQEYADLSKKEALTKLKSEFLSSMDEGRPGCTYGDTEYDSQTVVYGYNLAIEDMVHKIVMKK